MAEKINDVKIKQVHGHWEVHINGNFFCSADSYAEALNEIVAEYGLIEKN